MEVAHSVAANADEVAAVDIYSTKPKVDHAVIEDFEHSIEVGGDAGLISAWPLGVCPLNPKMIGPEASFRRACHPDQRSDLIARLLRQCADREPLQLRAANSINNHQ